MDNVNDAFNSIKATLYERISNPLLSSFFISWLIWNYKFTLVFFSSSMDAIEKIDFIDTTIFPFCFDTLLIPENGWTAIFLFFGPAGTTWLYLYILYPKLGKKVYEDHKAHIREYNDIKVEIEGKTSMSNEDIVELKSELRTIKGIHSSQLDAKEHEIELLKQDVEKVTKDSATARNKVSTLEAKQLDIEKIETALLKEKEINKQRENQIDKLQNEKDKLSKNLISLNNESSPSKDDGNAQNNLGEDEITVLKKLSHDPSWQHAHSFRKNLNLHRLRFDAAIESLIKGGYIETRVAGNLKQIKIGNKGEAYLVKNNLI